MLIRIISLMVFGFSLILPLSGHAQVQGTLTIAGKAIPISKGYAFFKPGFFDKTKKDVVVLLCNQEVPAAARTDVFARKKMIKTGGLSCIEQTIAESQQVINYKVENQAFKAPVGGGSTEHVFNAKLKDAKKIAGQSKTKSPQKSFHDIPYSYDITYDLEIFPGK